jgi:hypothetical protein
MDAADSISLVAIFDGRPSIEDIAKLALLPGPKMLYGTTTKKDNKTTVYRPF